MRDIDESEPINKSAAYKMGAHVLTMDDKSGEWKSGQIVGINKSGTYDVSLDGGKEALNVRPTHLKRQEASNGTNNAEGGSNGTNKSGDVQGVAKLSKKDKKKSGNLLVSYTQRSSIVLKMFSCRVSPLFLQCRSRSTKRRRRWRC